MLFSEALLKATYKSGRPPHLTEEHKRAEHHPFKKDFLFKDKAIPKDLYASRLIQHYLIIKAIEDKLQCLSEDEQESINPFFALSYLDALWRTSGIEQDLEQMDVDLSQIQSGQIAGKTSDYLDDIKKLPPKSLLAHFILHVAGFMHGGRIIQSRYINPSNKLTTYQIPANQYDFSGAASLLPDGKQTAIAVYHHMIAQMDTIEIDDEEYTELLAQCKGIYQTMSDIYDDLSVMHTHQPQPSNYMPFALASLCIIALTAVYSSLSEASSDVYAAPLFQPR